MIVVGPTVAVEQGKTIEILFNSGHVSKQLAASDDQYSRREISEPLAVSREQSFNLSRQPFLVRESLRKALA
jgi:hypothetical protein